MRERRLLFFRRTDRIKREFVVDLDVRSGLWPVDVRSRTSGGPSSRFGRCRILVLGWRWFATGLGSLGRGFGRDWRESLQSGPSRISFAKSTHLGGGHRVLTRFQPKRAHTRTTTCSWRDRIHASRSQLTRPLPAHSSTEHIAFGPSARLDILHQRKFHIDLARQRGERHRPLRVISKRVLAARLWLWLWCFGVGWPRRSSVISRRS